ncbi:hypothetical protein ACOKM5_07715 [Streptomyces sp. BH097]|uniref:hypothetical protein n=1 Tax=unclassified Streptomyces TaxID=2593676 RepID=UPI003BB6F12E
MSFVASHDAPVRALLWRGYLSAKDRQKAAQHGVVEGVVERGACSRDCGAAAEVAGRVPDPDTAEVNDSVKAPHCWYRDASQVSTDA